MKKINHYDVIVLGAGAAGLMSALTIGQSGLKVLVLEKSNKPGKKILMSGGGRCNFTNLNTSPQNFISANRHFCKSAISQYTPWHFLELVNKHNISYHEKELGQLFCDRSSKDILNMLLDECSDGQVEIRLNVDIEKLDYEHEINIQSSTGSFSSEYLVVATGGLSIPKMGGSDYGYQIAESMQLNILAKHPALVPFVFTDGYKELFGHLAGASIAVNISLFENKDAPSFSHQLLFTHRGLSGPAILQISSYWCAGQSLLIDLLPGIDVKNELQIAKKQSPQMTLNQWFSQYIPKKPAHAILKHEFNQWHDQPLQNLNLEKIQTVANTLNHWLLKPSGTEGYRTAEVTLGGIDTNEVSSKTMSCNKYPHVYFTGEVLDVTGHLGGYNFQWAWASAYACSHGIINDKRIQQQSIC